MFMENENYSEDIVIQIVLTTKNIGTFGLVHFVFRIEE